MDANGNMDRQIGVAGVVKVPMRQKSHYKRPDTRVEDRWSLQVIYSDMDIEGIEGTKCHFDLVYESSAC